MTSPRPNVNPNVLSQILSFVSSPCDLLSFIEEPSPADTEFSTLPSNVVWGTTRWLITNSGQASRASARGREEYKEKEHAAWLHLVGHRLMRDLEKVSAI